MLVWRDNLSQSVDALRAHKLRAVLTMIGLTMGVATLITVMTLVQGANLYVESKVANLGTNVFQVGRVPFAVTDFELIMKALKHKHIELSDMQALAAQCDACLTVGATAQVDTRARRGDKEQENVVFAGQSATMGEIDTRTIVAGRYFTPAEEDRASTVCLIGHGIVEQLFPGLDPVGKTLRVGNQELTVIGVYEKIGSVLGQDQDSFVVVPLSTYLRYRGTRNSLIINVKTSGEAAMETAMDQVRLILRARRHLTGNQEDDFYFGTKESYITLWKSISGAFFAVFVLVSSISAVVGGIVIMNVMLVSVTERTKEIGIRRAMGATRVDILYQFLTESVMQCLAGGFLGIALGFLAAEGVKSLTSFPASVAIWVAVLGVAMSSFIGLFFGIYPATRAARLDPVEALRSE
ncbi:MAG: ABC transporter permease [Bryobacteraceae bacterium]|nr:ABC transporter permease [Bryobacteraceae bacterium]